MDSGGSQFVVCGYSFTVCLDSFGNVWSFGGNVGGQLGHGNNSPQWEPKQIAGLEGIVSLACGTNHFVCVDYDGNVFACGENRYGSCGFDGGSSNLPRALSSFAFITSVSCGQDHTLCLDDGGKVWGFGCNSKSQLGMPSKIQSQAQPRLIENLSNISHVDCGIFHSVCLDYEGNIWTFGFNMCGQLGTGDYKKKWIPSKLVAFGGHPIVQFSCGNNHTMCIDDSGRVWGFGNNDFGQLGMKTQQRNLLEPI